METTARGGDGLAGAVLAPAEALEPIDVQATFDVAGPEDAPTLIFLHGTRATRAMWGPQVAGLTDRYRVVTVDLPGHGVLADTPFRMPGAVGVARSAIDRTGGRAIIVGHSLGGYVAMELAAAHPGLVAGLVLCNSTTEPRTVARRAPRAVGGYIVDRVGERFLGRGAPVPDSGPMAAPTPPATNGWLFKGGSRAAVAALRTSFVPRLAAYPGPTLLVNGAHDSLFRRGEGTFLAACRDGRLRVIDGAGHLVNSDQPAAFNATVREFAEVVFTRPAEG